MKTTRQIMQDGYIEGTEIDSRINCLCGNFMARVSIMANVKSTTFEQYLCFHCGSSTIAKSQTKRI